MRVRKTVCEEPVTIDEAPVHVQYEVRRVRINRVVENTSPSRVEGDTTIIPVYEEETVTITRLVLREEVHLVRRQRIEHRPRTLTLRKENVEVQRIASESGSRTVT